MNTKTFTLEEILRNVNIQGNLRDLQSGDEEKVRGALRTLASVSQLANRKDCLFALAGYYALEVRSIEDMEFFFDAVKLAHSPEITRLILQDLVSMREASRRRLLMNDLLRSMYMVLRQSTPEQVEVFRGLIESAVWGDKQKTRFLSALRS